MRARFTVPGRWSIRASLALALAAAACGSEEAPAGSADAASPDAPVADAAAPDAPPPDAAGPDALPPLGVGLPCADNAACGQDGFCLDEGEGFPTAGYCTRGCAADLDCGGDAFCAPPLDMQGTRLCFQRCGAGGTCASAAHVCSQRLFGQLTLPQSLCMFGDATAHDGDACQSFAECNAGSTCLANPFEFPGGYCLTFGCTPGMNATCAPGGDGQCFPAGPNTLCVDGCTADGQCRQAEGYSCQAVPGAGVKACLVLHQQVGSACASDAQCGPVALGWQCLKSGGFTGGYCGHLGCTPGNAATCPLDTPCFDPTPANPGNGDAFCARPCQTASDCRMAEGYTCDATAKVCRP